MTSRPGEVAQSWSLPSKSEKGRGMMRTVPLRSDGEWLCDCPGFLYRNPTNHDLIIFDTETKEMLVLEQITRIRAIVQREVVMGDGGDRSRRRKIAARARAENWKNYVERIRQLKGRGWSVSDIAGKVGVSQPTVTKDMNSDGA